MGLRSTPIFFWVDKKNCPPYASTQVHYKHFTGNRDQHSEWQIIDIIIFYFKFINRNLGELENLYMQGKSSGQSIAIQCYKFLLNDNPILYYGFNDHQYQ